ncbi:MAG: hypothetical protein QF530_13770, partial [SAR202 cluster bacterium]|nr:hypothetical protein [SAR202 cluster bacterium]
VVLSGRMKGIHDCVGWTPGDPLGEMGLISCDLDLDDFALIEAECVKRGGVYNGPSCNPVPPTLTPVPPTPTLTPVPP